MCGTCGTRKVYVIFFKKNSFFACFVLGVEDGLVFSHQWIDALERGCVLTLRLQYKGMLLMRKFQRLIVLFGHRSLCFYAAKLIRLPHTQGQAALLREISTLQVVFLLQALLSVWAVALFGQCKKQSDSDNKINDVSLLNFLYYEQQFPFFRVCKRC